MEHYRPRRQRRRSAPTQYLIVALLSALVVSTIQNTLAIKSLTNSLDSLPHIEISTSGDDITGTTSTTYEIEIDPIDVEYLANVAWGEARGCSTTEQAAVMWCVLNRVDSPEFPNTVKEVVTEPGQFDGYSESNPIEEYLADLAEDVLIGWNLEKLGEDGGRVLPKEYMYFTGDGTVNYFYTNWYNQVNAWDWSLPSPYKEVN